VIGFKRSVCRTLSAASSSRIGSRPFGPGAVGRSMTGRLRAGAVGAGAKRFDLVPTVSGGRRRLPSERALLCLK
jgi:hypothetical protein